MPHSREEQYQKFLLPLFLFMQLSIKSYNKYLKNKIYLHALTIKSANTRIYNLIVTNPEYIPEDLHDDVLNLLNHYDIWFAQFNDYEMKIKPVLSDNFIFTHLDEQCAFPRASEQKIFQYYHDFKKAIDIK